MSRRSDENKMIIVQAVQMINTNEVLDSINFKISLISFYCPAHVPCTTFCGLGKYRNFSIKWFQICFTQQVICFINKEISEEKLKTIVQASSFIFSVIVLIRFLRCENSHVFTHFLFRISRNLGRFLQWNKSNWFCVNRR